VSWTETIAAAFRSVERAARRTFRRKVSSTPFPEKDHGVPFNASGVAWVGPRRFIFVDNHESSSLFEFTLDDKEKVQRIRRRRLVGIAEGQLGDAEGLTRVDVNGETFLIVASSLCVTGGGGRRQVNDGLVRVRYTVDGDLHADGMPGFRDWLLSHDPALAAVSELEPDAGGLNIEGLTWDPRVRSLLFGLRGPAHRGQVTVIRVPVDAVAAWTTAALGVPSAVIVRTPQSTVTQGIRDACVDEETGDVLILLGRSLSGGNEPFQLCAWNGSDDLRLMDVKFHRSMKPEGITTFSSGGTKKLLVVDDRGGYAVLDARNADQ